MNPMIEQVLNGHILTETQSQSLFEFMLTEEIEPILISAILIAMKTRKESSEEIAGVAKALLKHSVPLALGESLVADCCGTGGDGQGLLNISTAVSFVAAACGLPIVKHGNRSVSSLTGSADVLECLGLELITEPEILKAQFKELGLTFAFAPFFHPLLKNIMPIRKTLATRTVFNLVGPLVNPARPQIQLMGVYDPCYCEPIAKTLVSLGVINGMVVNGSGLDEIAIHAKTDVALIQQGQLSLIELSPTDFGVRTHSLDSLKGADPKYNAQMLLQLLKGQGLEAYVDAVAVNTAALLYSAHYCKDLKQGVDMAKNAIVNGNAFNLFDGLKNFKHFSAKVI